MNTCHFTKQAAAYIDGQLKQSEKNVFEGHLKSCPVCLLETTNLKKLSQSMKSWPVPEVGEEFSAAVVKKIVAREMERSDAKMKPLSLRYFIPSGVIAGILVFLFVGVKQQYQGKIPVAKAPQQTVALKTQVPFEENIEKKADNWMGKNDKEASYDYYSPSKREDFDDLRPLTYVSPVDASLPGYFPQQSEVFEEEYARIYDNDFLTARDNPLSTFSIDVDTASYSNVRRFLNGNQLPPADAVRIEEMVNYFSYDYPQPLGNDPFSINTEIGVCPWNKGHKLVLVGLQGRNVEVKNLPPANLVFLIDVSGSMEDYNKLPLLKQAFRLLVNQLRKEDTVSIVVYAGASGVVLDSAKGDNKDKVIDVLDRLRAGGSTAGAEGIELAYQIAKKNFLKHGNNRVILATDGDFNVGITSESELIRLIEARRDDGIFLTIVGFGMGNYKDSKMEKMADKGNGSIAYIDNLLEAKKVFVSQLTGTLLTIAKDVKIQVEFNPAEIKAYRLVGYENRKLENKDFNDDKKDAGELGAGHTVTAIYEIVAADSQEEFGSTDPLKYQQASVKASDEMLTVKLRYKEPDKDTSLLLTRVVKAGEEKAVLSQNLNFASSVAEFGMLLRDSKYKAEASYPGLIERAKASKGSDSEGYRAEFIKLVEIAQMLVESKN